MGEVTGELLKAGPPPRDILDYRIGELTIPQEGWEVPDLERVFKARKSQKWKRTAIRRMAWELQCQITELEKQNDELHQANLILDAVVQKYEDEAEAKEESGLILPPGVS